MYPIICQVGPLTVYSYGLMLAFAVFLCTFLLQKEALKKGINPNFIFDFVFWVVLTGIIGSRLFFVFLNFSYFAEHPLEVVMLHRGGLAWQGGLIMGAAAAFFLIKKSRLPFKATLDFFAPYIALGQAIGRLGCFLNGCCFGREVSWGIYFPAHQAHLHPTQLYDSFGLFLLFFILKKFQLIKKQDGEVFILYILWASFERFIIEFFRADHISLLGGLSIFQVVSLGIIAVGLYAYRTIKS